MAGSMSRPVLAASIAVFRDGKVLLAQRGKAPARGLFSLPGGRIEPGERMAEAVLRELQEEVGLTARIAGFVDHVEHIEHSPDGALVAHAVICAFAGYWTGGEAMISDEAQALLWVDPLDPGDLPMTRGLPDILRKAQQLIARETGQAA
ncbi:MAG: NUDIX hydrolase [Methylobacterium sp.]|jgi:8-oxo-dGTP diphosphatase|nr:NUDIX hydrolase [Methylobacterium sp.]